MLKHLRSVVLISVLVLALAFAAAACGGDDDDGGNGPLAPDDSGSENGGDGGGSGDDNGSGNGDDGGSDDGDDDDPLGGDDDDGGDDNGEDDDNPLDDFDFGDGFAVVTVGDTRYEFAMGGNLEVGTTTYIGTCFTLFGVIGGSGYDPEGSGTTVDIEVPPEDWETSGEDWDPPSIRVSDDANSFDWRAGGSVVTDFDIDPEMSGVTSFTNDGDRASGTAVFVNLNDAFTGEELEAVEGTFEIECADD